MSEKRKGDAVPGGARATDTLFGEQMNITGGAEEKSDEIKHSDLAENEKITLADNWRTVNNEVFDENSIICPTCKQELPAEQIEHLKATFQQSKVDRLNKIEKIGMEKKNYIAEIQATLDKLEQENKDNLLKKAEIDKLIELLKENEGCS